MKWSVEQLMQHTKLSRDNIQGIINLATLEQTPTTKIHHLAEMQSMLESVVKDIDFHEKLVHWDKDLQQEQTGVNHETVHKLHQLAYGTRHLEQIESILESMPHEKPTELDKNQPEKSNKITLKQYAILYDLAELKPLLDEFQKKGLIKGCDRLEQLHRYVTQAETLVKQLDPQFQRVFTPPEPPTLISGEEQKTAIFNKLLSQVNATLSLDGTKNLSAQYRAEIQTLKPDTDNGEDNSTVKKP